MQFLLFAFLNEIKKGTSSKDIVKMLSNNVHENDRIVKKIIFLGIYD